MKYSVRGRYKTKKSFTAYPKRRAMVPLFAVAGAVVRYIGGGLRWLMGMHDKHPQLATRRRRMVFAAFALLFIVCSFIPTFGDWVISSRATPKASLITPGALNTQKQRFVPPKTEGITDAAKATAIGEDPVAVYQKEQENQKGKPADPARIIPESEIKEKRTAFSNTYLNTEGGETERIHTEPVNYKPDHGKGPWTPIAGQIKEDTAYNASESKKESLISRVLPGKPFIKKGLRQDTGFVRSTFKSLAESDGITVGFDGTADFGVVLLGADPEVNPDLGTFEDGQQYTMEP